MPFAVAAAGIGAAGALGSAAMQSSTAGKASGAAQRNLQLVLPQMQQSYNQTVGGYQGLLPQIQQQYDPITGAYESLPGQIQQSYNPITGAYASLPGQIQQSYNPLISGYQPYAAGGAASTSDMQDLLGLNGQDAANAALAKFQASPGYQWQLGQGLRAVDAGAASQGMLRSGATLKAEQTYGQGLADQEFGNYYNRLSGVAGQGLTGLGGAGAATQNMYAGTLGALGGAGTSTQNMYAGTLGALGGAGNATANMFGNLLTAQSGIAGANQNLIANETGNAGAVNTAMIGGANAQNSILGNTSQGLTNTANNLLNNKGFQDWASGLFGGNAVSPTTVTNNSMYQQGAFAAQPAGTYGPFR